MRDGGWRGEEIGQEESVGPGPSFRPVCKALRQKEPWGPPAANLHAAMESLDGSPPLAVATEGKNNIGPQGMVGIAPSP